MKLGKILNNKTSYVKIMFFQVHVLCNTMMLQILLFERKTKL